MQPEEKNNKIIGALGEDIAANFLKTKGFAVVDKNYRKKWGEIDIVAKKDGIIHFVEVKAVKYFENMEQRPEENVHEKKLKRLERTIQSYISEKKEGEREWQLDVIAVFLDLNKKEARVRFTENVF
ncbi:MAG: YraN family protein [Patescibacteria group bacterium]